VQGKFGLLGMLAIGAAALVAAIFFLSDNSSPGSASAAYTVPGKPNMTPEVAHQLFFQVGPALLTVVFQALEKTDETDAYDTLQTVTAGDALEQLFSQRSGVMASIGLDGPDQKVHEIKLLDTKAVRRGTKIEIDASWQVIGTVGDTGHVHVLGNTYSAEMTAKPVQGAWRITDFNLLDIRTDGAGEIFTVPSQ